MNIAFIALGEAIIGIITPIEYYPLKLTNYLLAGLMAAYFPNKLGGKHD